MKTLFAFLAFFAAFQAHADVMITQLPLGAASATTNIDVFPFVNVTTNTTEKMKVWDLMNLPAFTSPGIGVPVLMQGALSVNGAAISSNTWPLNLMTPSGSDGGFLLTAGSASHAPEIVFQNFAENAFLTMGVASGTNSIITGTVSGNAVVSSSSELLFGANSIRVGYFDLSGNFFTLGNISTSATTAATNITTGAIIDSGGLGVAGNVYVGGMTVLAQFTNAATSGQVNAASISPIYNQISGTAANTDLLIARTETAVGSGAQYLIQGTVGGSTEFSVLDTGKIHSSSLTPSTPVFTDSGNGLVSTGTVGIANGGTNASSAVTGAVPNTTSTSVSSWTVTPTLGVAGTSTGTITLASSGDAAYTTLIEPAASPSPSVTFQLPANNGSNGNFLTTNGSGATSWGTPTGFANPMTSVGDMIYSNSATGTAARLADNSSSTLAVLSETGPSPTPSWLPSTGSGNVVLATSPTLVTPNLGTPSTLVGTNISGTASSLTAGNINGTLAIANGGTNTTTGVAGAVPNSSSTSASTWTVTPTLGVAGTSTGTLTLASSGDTAYTTKISPAASPSPSVTFTLPSVPGTSADTLASLAAAQTFSGQVTFSSTSGVTSVASNNGGTFVAGIFENSSNTASSKTEVKINSAGSSASDLQLHFLLSGVQDWTFGAQASTSSLIMSAGTALNSSPEFTLTTGGNLTLNGTTLTMANLASTTGDALCWNTSSHVFGTDTSNCIASSIRFKQNVVEISPKDALQEVMSSKPVSFEYKKEFAGPYTGRQVGFIAEDMAKVDKRLTVYEKDGTTPHSVRYMQMTAIDTAAIKELKREIDELKTEVFLLKAGVQ